MGAGRAGRERGCIVTRLSTARRALVAVVLGALVSVCPIGAPDAHALVLVSGACAPTFTVSFSPPMTAVPGPRTMSITGAGTCVANGSIGTINITGGLNSVAWSCEAGVAVGAVSLSFHVPIFNQTYIAATIVAENVAGVVVVEITYNLTQLVAVGVFAQSPVSSGANCATGLSTTTWTGAFVFNDPETTVAVT